MTPHGIVKRSTVDDAEELLRNLRKEDLRELEEVGGRPARHAIMGGVLLGAPSLTLRTHKEELVGILSVVRFGSGIGFIAMSGTDLITENRTAFLRGSRDVLAHLDTKFDMLLNVCDARNEVHIRWLRWLGFSLIRKIDHYGPHRVPVYEFARIRQCAPL